MRKTNKIYKNIACILLLLFFSSCIDEIYNSNEAVGSSFISVRGMGDQSLGEHSGDAEDYVVHSLRILSFDSATGDCTTNIYYNAWLGDIIKHAISPGKYDFVFLANEPLQQSIVNSLNGISTYTDLNEIAYPGSFFSSERIIPMIQEIKNVTVLPNGKGARLENGTEVSLLELALNRLAIRVDVILESDNENFKNKLKGVTFSNIPDYVPLTVNYTGPVIERNGTRMFTQDENSSYFSDTNPTRVESTWAKQVARIILPANELKSTGDKNKAIVFTVDMLESYSPSCELKINQDPVNYSLPINTKLDLLGIIKNPLEVNIQASEWDKIDNGWNISGNKRLNVSSLEVSITDFNGARISFSSNMPVVKILPELYIGSSTATVETESIFNDLVLKEGDLTDNGTTVTYTTSRFSYMYDQSSKTGTGYMDIVLDELNVMNKQEIYRIILSAEDEDGGKLQREIKVNVSQYGRRFEFNSYGEGYIGAFFRNSEMGERIVTGQQSRISGAGERPDDIGQLKPWRVYVEQGDFIVLSTTPSFDPYVGTDNPGYSEHYTVRPNEWKGEDGTYVEGRGRIYFRIGVSDTHSGAPRYGKVRVERYGGRWGTGDNDCWYYKEYMYIRQGETDDYLMRPGMDDPIDKGPLQGKSRDYARKISPYNLTAPTFMTTGNNAYYQIDINKGEFVKYPSQVGAFFQWGLPKKDENTDYFRVAYHPTQPVGGPELWSRDIRYLQYVGTSAQPFYPVWGEASGVADGQYDYGYKNTFEVCPKGYHRPSDGYTDRISYNGIYPNYLDRNNGNQAVVVRPADSAVPVLTPAVDYSENIAYSEWRQSVFKSPRSGDAGIDSIRVDGIKVDRVPNFWEGVNTSNNEEVQEYVTLCIGLYADGFFDRRPIKQGIGEGSYPFGVSTDNAKAAYRGILIYNENYNNASVFFPMAGRRGNSKGNLEFVGTAGYYHSASTGPSSYETPHSVWSMGFGRWPPPALMFQLPTFAQSVRCVKNEEITIK